MVDHAEAVAAVDQVAIVDAWLKQHPANVTLLGGPDHVSGIFEAPWPHVVCSDGPNSDLRNLRWDTEHEVSLEVIGRPDGYPGPAELRRVALRQLQLVRELTDRPPAPGQPSVNRVTVSNSCVWAPLANGQPRYIVYASIVAHPSIL